MGGCRNGRSCELSTRWFGPTVGRSSSTPDEFQGQYNEGSHQEDVDQAAHREIGEHPEQPQDDEKDRNRRQHVLNLSVELYRLMISGRR